MNIFLKAYKIKLVPVLSFHAQMVLNVLPA
jgi:hypothetical protein